LGSGDSFTEAEHARSAGYHQRVQKAGRITAFSQLAIAGYAVLFTSHRFDHDAWLPTLVITIVVLCIATSIPAIANGAWRALVLDRRVGLSVVKAGSWSLKTARINALAIALSLITGVSLFAVIRYGEPWWLLAWLVLAASVAIRSALSPIFVRLGNKTTSMPPELVHVMEKVRVSMGVRPPRTRVLSNDSRVVPNAMVSGLGPFRTLYFTEPVLSIPSAEFEAVLAHELAHVRNRDIEKTVGMLAVLRSHRRCHARLRH
jgi:Zn-dependent protease with chaperone function